MSRCQLVMSHRAPFSSPPLRLYARSAGVHIGDDWPSWAPAALWRTAPETSPVRAVASIGKHRDELTKSSERLLKHSAISLLTDGQLPWLMDVDEARSTLKAVATKAQTRAAKRKAEADAAAEAELRDAELESWSSSQGIPCDDRSPSGEVSSYRTYLRNTGRVDVRFKCL